MSRLLSSIMLITSLIETGTSPVRKNWLTFGVVALSGREAPVAEGSKRCKKSFTQSEDAIAGMANVTLNRREVTNLVRFINLLLKTRDAGYSPRLHSAC